MICYRCGGSGSEIFWHVPREEGCMNFSVIFATKEYALVFCKYRYDPVGEQKICDICKGIGVIEHHIPCKVCNDTGKYIAIVNNVSEIRNCEICVAHTCQKT